LCWRFFELASRFAIEGGEDHGVGVGAVEVEVRAECHVAGEASTVPPLFPENVPPLSGHLPPGGRPPGHFAAAARALCRDRSSTTTAIAAWLKPCDHAP
jgi:hypothetical protein